jgi:hypothetical protein
MKAYKEMANNSPQAKQLKAYQQMADNSSQLNVQHNTAPVVQRVIDTDAKAIAVARHILDNHPTTKSKKVKADSRLITDAIAAIVPAITYTNTAPELALIKQKIDARRTEIKDAADLAEATRKTNLNALYAMNATAARAHLNTLSAPQITALGARVKVFRTYNTQWGLGSEYMFENGNGPLAQFVVHVHWDNTPAHARSGVRFKPHSNKDRALPGMVALDDAKAAALGIPGTYGEAELLAMEPAI